MSTPHKITLEVVVLKESEKAILIQINVQSLLSFSGLYTNLEELWVPISLIEDRYNIRLGSKRLNLPKKDQMTLPMWFLEKEFGSGINVF